MTALILLFALAVWILLTLAATRWGSKWMRAALPQKKWAGVAGAFIGFMLLMGGWWLYWGVEYLQVRANAKEMCKQAGVKVYITPEEWKKMVGGEEAWKQIKLIDQLPPQEMKDTKFIFNNKEYKIRRQINNRVFIYNRYEGKPYILLTDRIYLDHTNKVVLYQSIGVDVGARPSSLKFWVPDLSCTDKKGYFSSLKQYFYGF